MKVPDLWLLIKSLGGTERTRFRKFLASPYFNSDEKHIELFEAIYEQVHEERCDREALDAILFPYQPYAYTRITNLISDLKKLLETFFVQEALKNETFRREYLGLLAMRKRGLEKPFVQGVNRIKKELKGKNLQQETDFLQNYQIEEEEYQFSVLVNEKDRPKLIARKIKSLHLFYILATLRSVCQDLEWKEESGVENKGAHKVFIHYILNNQDLYKQEPLLRIYMCVLRTLMEPADSQLVKQLIAELISLKARLSKEEIWNLFQFVQRHWLRLDKADKTVLNPSVYNLFQHIFAYNWLYKKGFFTPEDGWHFIALGIELKKFEEVEAFITYYERQVNIVEKKTLNFYQAYFKYQAQSNVKEAAELLEGEDFEHTAFDIEVPLLLSAMYYDRYQIDALSGVWDNFLSYLKKGKDFSAKEREPYLSLRKVLKKLMKLRTLAKISQPAVFEKSRLKLLEEIHVLPAMSITSWLIQEAHALKSS